MRKIIFAGLLFITSQLTNAQISSNLQGYVKELAYNSQKEINFISLKETAGIAENTVESFINDVIFNNGVNRVSVLKTEKDTYGFTHTRYNILQNGIVLHNQVIVGHCLDGKLVSMNGELRMFNEPLNAWSIDEKSALAFALKKVNAKKYKWENKEEQQHMREVWNNPGFSYDPVGVKTIFEKEGKLYNAYKFNIYAEEPLYRADVFVDAASGGILEEQNQICTINVPGTAATKYSGTQTVTIDQNGAVFRLRETTRGLGVETYNMNNTATYASNDFTSSTSAFTGVNNDQGARDAHWGAQKTYDYYFTKHNRNSVNNAGMKLLSYIHYNTNYANAFWNGNAMTYGDGNGSTNTIFTALDICGHEMTHGVTGNSAGLIYSNESGALNEAFSDIFGTCIENDAKPASWNWKMGENISPGGTPLRDMSNPGAYGHPDTYGGQFWYIGTADNGGVHTNSGVANFWFYLLTSGGSGVNDIGNPYSVSPVGFQSASRIAYRALTVYFTPTTNYANARILSLQAAKDLFGACSFEYEQTAKAWYAVGVGANYSTNVVGPDFASMSTSFCNVPATVTFTNTTSNGQTFSWSFGDGGTANTINATHTYTTGGTFNVKLKGTGCGNVTDSITKTAFIAINIPAAPIVTNGFGCGPGPVTLTATGNGTMNWFTSQFSQSPLASGPTFLTPNLTSNTIFYVANSVPNSPVAGGMLNNLTGNGGTAASPLQWLKFDVLQNSVLNSVVVYANSQGNRTVELRNSSGVIYSTTFNITTTGANTLVLNYNLTPGTNYELGLNSNSMGYLYRNTSGIFYPYNIGGCVSITGGSSSGYYFWFYNWKVSKADCVSPAVAITASVLPAATTTSLSVSKNVFCVGDAPVSVLGSPAGGVFSGLNVSGALFNPQIAGNSVLVYTYSDPNGCSDTSSVLMKVSDCTGLTPNHFNDLGILVFPNPATDRVVIKNEGGVLHLSMIDAGGRQVLSQPIQTGEETLNLNGFARGIYLLNFKDFSGKIVKSTKLLKH